MKRQSLVLLWGLTLALCVAGNVQAGALIYEAPTLWMWNGAHPGAIRGLNNMGMDNSGRLLVDEGPFNAVVRVTPGQAVDLVMPVVGGAYADPIQDAAGNYVVGNSATSIRRYTSAGVFIMKPSSKRD